MKTRKVSKEEWDFEVKRVIRTRKANRQKMQRTKYLLYEKILGKYMPVPYLLGVAAAVLLIVIYGWTEFFKFFLSWVVSVTIIATLAYHLWKYYEEKI